MKRVTIVGGAMAIVLVVVALATHRAAEHGTDPAVARDDTEAPAVPRATEPASAAHRGFLYGRVTTADGATYEGRLRFGGTEEAFWDDAFNGAKNENPWATLVPPAELMERRPFEIFGVEIAQRKHRPDLTRPFMARFGDITRIEAEGRDLRVTLKSGTTFDLDRFDADDVGDGVRVWDDRQGIVDLDDGRIRVIELFPTARLGDAPGRLHGTVRTRLGEFTGFIQWNREKGVGTDEIRGRTADGPLDLRFDTIHTIARQGHNSSRVTLHDGRELALSGSRDVGRGNRGVYVDDPRYGRVLVSWDAFERIDFNSVGSDVNASGPAYDDFPPGRPLTGSVTTRDGERLAGRLVYDLDESETTETLDAPADGVDYIVPFGLVASIVPGSGEGRDLRAHVVLHSGQTLRLEHAGDLGERHGGMLVFVDGGERPAYVRWSDVEKVELDRPPTMVPKPQPGPSFG